MDATSAFKSNNVQPIIRQKFVEADRSISFRSLQKRYGRQIRPFWKIIPPGMNLTQKWRPEYLPQMHATHSLQICCARSPTERNLLTTHYRNNKVASNNPTRICATANVEHTRKRLYNFSFVRRQWRRFALYLILFPVFIRAHWGNGLKSH